MFLFGIKPFIQIFKNYLLLVQCIHTSYLDRSKYVNSYRRSSTALRQRFLCKEKKKEDGDIKFPLKRMEVFCFVLLCFFLVFFFFHSGM